MLQKILDVAWLHIKTTYQSRITLIFGIVMPIVFTAVMGVGMMGFAPNEVAEDPTWQVDVVNLDRGHIADELVTRLDADAILAVSEADAAAAAAHLEDQSVDATLTLPAGMSAQLLAGQKVSLDFRLNAQDALAGQVVEQAVLSALNEVSGSLEIAAASQRVADQLDFFAITGVSQAAYFDEGFAAAQAAWAAGAPISVQPQKETQREDTEVDVPMGFQQSSPGIGVMFALFFVVNGAGTLLQEREDGTLRRLMVTPISKGAILGGKLLGVYISAIVQFAILVLVGQFAFDVDWGQSPSALVLMVLSFTFCITALAMMIAALVRSYAQIDAFSMLIILPLSGLGGAMWPLEIVPAFMQRVSLFTPTGWAMRGFHDIVTRGLALPDITQEAAMLALFGVVFLAVGVWRFKYE